MSSRSPNNQQLAGQNDIVIRTRFELDKSNISKGFAIDAIKQQMAGLKRVIQSTGLDSTMADATKRMDYLNKKMANKNFKATGPKGAQYVAEKANLERYIQAKQTLSKVEANLAGTTAHYNDELLNNKRKADDAATTQKKLQNEVMRTSVRFSGAAMSIMFFGMALQRMGNQLWQFGTKAFNEISSSVEGSTNSVQMLQGSMKYLGFTLGQALEPAVLKLIEFTDWLSDIVAKYPGLFRFITLFSIIAGTLLFLGGTLMLAGNGFLEFGLKLGFVKTNADGVVTSIMGISKAGLKNTWSKMTSGISNAIGKLGSLKDNLKWIKANPVKSIFGGLVLAAIIAVIAWLNRLQKNMGGWEELFKNAGRGAAEMFAYIGAGLAAVVIKARDMWNSIFNKDKVSTLSFKDAFDIQLADNMAKVLEDFGEPMNGFIDDSRSLSEIWKGEIYPEIEAVNEAMEGVADTSKMLKEFSFSQSDIMKLFDKNLLTAESMGALLYADNQNNATLDDQTNAMIASILKGQTGETAPTVIHNLTVNSDASSIEEILESLKSFT